MFDLHLKHKYLSKTKDQAALQVAKYKQQKA